MFDQFSHANVLQRDMYPSATKFEGEIIAMASDLLHGTGVGVVTSGGTESLITALYSYRELARAGRGVTKPNVVMPVTAHVALDKGAHWMDVEVRKTPLTGRYVADVAAMAARSTTRPSRSSPAPATTPTASSTRSPRSGRSRSRTASACTSTAASAAGCCPGSSVSATTCRSGTSECPA